MCSELGWVIATISMASNLYLGYLLWRQAMIVAELQDLREAIDDHAAERDRGSTFTR